MRPDHWFYQINDLQVCLNAGAFYNFDDTCLIFLTLWPHIFLSYVLMTIDLGISTAGGFVHLFCFRYVPFR